MTEQPSKPKDLGAPRSGYFHRHFDGIQFLWQTPETRYLVKLILGLFGAMIIYFSLLYFLGIIFGEPTLLVFLGEIISIMMFLFVLIELFRFYWNDRKYQLFPEKNPLLQMKYWPSPKPKWYKRLLKLILSLIFLGILFIFSYLLGVTYLYELLMLFFYVIPIIVFFTAFVAVKGTMITFNESYAEKFQQQGRWFFLLVPVPWILLILLTFMSFLALEDTLGPITAFWIQIIAWILYGFLCVLGLLALIKRSWRASYTTSQLAASYTFVFVVLIPMFIGIFFDLLGPIVSILAMGFFFIQGTLDEHGDELREYYSAWEKKLQTFQITSEADFQQQTYDRAFETTPLETDVPSAYRNLMWGLGLLFVTFFGLLFLIMPEFPYFGTEIGIRKIERELNLFSLAELFAITLALFIYVIMIVFRKQTPVAVTPTPPTPGIAPTTTICPSCGTPNEPTYRFCKTCGTQLK